MITLTDSIYQYGINKANVKERDIAFGTLSKYKSFCNELAIKSPNVSILSLCISAFLTLQFYIDYPAIDLPAEDFAA